MKAQFVANFDPPEAGASTVLASAEGMPTRPVGIQPMDAMTAIWRAFTQTRSVYPGSTRGQCVHRQWRPGPCAGEHHGNNANSTKSAKSDRCPGGSESSGHAMAGRAETFDSAAAVRRSEPAMTLAEGQSAQGCEPLAPTTPAFSENPSCQNSGCQSGPHRLSWSYQRYRRQSLQSVLPNTHRAAHFRHGLDRSIAQRHPAAVEERQAPRQLVAVSKSRNK